MSPRHGSVTLDAAADRPEHCASRVGGFEWFEEDSYHHSWALGLNIITLSTGRIQRGLVCERCLLVSHQLVHATTEIAVQTHLQAGLHQRSSCAPDEHQDCRMCGPTPFGSSPSYASLPAAHGVGSKVCHILMHGLCYTGKLQIAKYKRLDKAAGCRTEGAPSGGCTQPRQLSSLLLTTPPCPGLPQVQLLRRRPCCRSRSRPCPPPQHGAAQTGRPCPPR